MSFSITFDYRFDSTGFFDEAARAALEEAGRIWEGLIGDEFADVPAGIAFDVVNPSDRDRLETVTLETPIDDLIIFVGAEDLGGSLGLAGPTGTGIGGLGLGDAFASRIAPDFRGQGPVTDAEPWAGSITFSPTAPWSFDLAGPVEGANDFLTTALHEIGHVLGIGTLPAFNVLVANDSFTGPNATAAAGGPVPLDDTLHVEEGFDDDQVLLDPRSTVGVRTLPSDIDLGILADIGYEIDGFTRQGSQPAITTPGPDSPVFGTGIGDTLDGLGGDDLIQGEGGGDTVTGGDGMDTLFGQAGADSLAGGTGADQLQGGSGADTLLGGGGDDLIFGQGGSDRAEGGAGNDQVGGGGGDDTLTGGAGSDTLIGDAGTDSFAVAPGHGETIVNDFEFGGDRLLVDPAFGLASADAVLATVSKPFGNVSRLALGDGTTIDLFHDAQQGTPLTAADISIESVIDDTPAPVELPDLRITALTISETDWNPGETVSVAGTVANQGDGAASGTELEVYLSVDAAIGPDDTLLGRVDIASSIPAGGTASFSLAVQVSALSGVLAPGAYNVGAIADPGDEILEENEANNSAAPVAVELLATSANPILGTPSDDQIPDRLLQGTPGDDVIDALAGNDVVIGSAGTDRIEGGLGTDRLAYNGDRGAFSVLLSEDGSIEITKPQGAFGGGTDLATGIERVDFRDGDLIFDLESPNLEDGYSLYAAAFARTPDEGGLRFWVGQLDAGVMLRQVADAFVLSDEFAEAFGADPTVEEYVDALYENVLARGGEVDEAGRLFWIDALTSGRLDESQMLIAFAQSAENSVQTAEDISNGILVLNDGLDFFA